MKLRLSIAFVLVLSACTKEAPPPEQKAPVEKAPEPKAPAETRTATTAAAQVPNTQTPPVAAGGSNITGTVRFEGKAPAAQPVDMRKDAACVKANPKATIEEVKVRDGALANVFVYVKSGLPAGQKFAPPETPVTLDQQGCLYHPTVLGVQVGQPLVILNSDALLHNVHGFVKGAEFNSAMPKQGQKIEKKLKKEQVLISVKCEVHPWMHAWIGAVDHPFFAVTDEKGGFELKNLPKGSYELELVHPTLGTQTARADAGGTVTVAFKAK